MLTILARFLRRKLALAGAVVILVICIAAIGAPYFAPYSPSEQFFDGLTLEGAPLPPNERFWFGTDLLGRDLFSRILYGARTSPDHRHRRQRHRGAARHHSGRHGRLCSGLGRRGHHALHRSDDGFPGAAAGDRACRHLQAEPVDRRAGHRHGELGAGGARHLRQTLSLSAQEYIEAVAFARRPLAAHPVRPHRAASAADRPGVGDARHRDHRAA